MSSRIKFIKSADLDEVESTVNNLLSLGWEITNSLSTLSNGEYLISMITYDRRPEYYTESTQTGQRVGSRRYRPEPEIVENTAPVEVRRGTGSLPPPGNSQQGEAN